VRLVWTWPSRRGQGQTREQRVKFNLSLHYNMLHWLPPHINGAVFAELDSYDMHGLSAMISRNFPNNTLRYILGATGEDLSRLRRVPSEWLSCIDYVFIDSYETVRAWLLSNPVLADQLDLMIYCYLNQRDTRRATRSLRAYQYLHVDAVADWADSAAGDMGNRYYPAPYLPSRVEYGNANGSGDDQDGEALSVSLLGLSSQSSDIAGTRCKGQDSPGMPLPTVCATNKSAMASTLLAVKYLSRVNIPMSSDLHRRLRRGSETRKCSAAVDDENLDVLEFKKICLHASKRESMKGAEGHIGGDLQGDSCGELIFKTLPRGSMAGGCLQNVTNETVGQLPMVSK